MTCPSCQAPLQRLAGADGYQVKLVIDPRSWGLLEARIAGPVYACPVCDHVQGGRQSKDGPR